MAHGKTTTANAILNNPEYEKTEGTIKFEGEEITNKKTDEIARKGIFMSFQLPEEIPRNNSNKLPKSFKKQYNRKTSKNLRIQRRAKKIHRKTRNKRQKSRKKPKCRLFRRRKKEKRNPANASNKPKTSNTRRNRLRPRRRRNKNSFKRNRNV